MKQHYKCLSIFLILFFTGCAIQPPTPPIQLGLEIKVGLVWGKKSVEFSMDKSGRIISYDGHFIAKGIKGKRWKAEVLNSEPAKVVYRLIAGSMNELEKARFRALELEKIGLNTHIQSNGQNLSIGRKKINKNLTYRIYLNKRFHDIESARIYRDKIWNKTETFIIREVITKSKGTILLTNLENNQQFESSKPILIKDSSVTLFDIPVGTGYHWEHQEIRQYPETIRFELDSEGNLAVINVLPLEKYLMGVVPSEMSFKFPYESLKAQAVAARCVALNKLGLVHTHEPFDICSDVHCQVYSGLSKRTPITDRAVISTLGLIMSKSGEICTAVYSAVCGGHGEDTDKAWGGKPKNYLKGRYDGGGSLKRYGSLNDERYIRRWIDDIPHAYCNTTQNTAPESMEYTKKYFRWELPIPQKTLKESIKKITDKNIGQIIDIVPQERGCSGRIIRLKVIGENGEHILKSELSIRKALSPNTLWSSCFYIVKHGHNRNSPPTQFILRGAGFGHGVGMCQTGAAMMALKGKSFNRILKHYYKGIQIKRLY
jgi:SpoIID/LytB domain protein